MTETVLVYLSWDSGPYSIREESDEENPRIDGPGGYGTNVVPIPAPVWERYVQALEDLDAATESLSVAEEKALKLLRAADPRWKNR